MLLAIAEKFWPELKTFSAQRRYVGAGEVLAFLYSIPLALASLVWLAAVTDLEMVRSQWPVLVLLAALMILFRMSGFFLIAEIRTGRYASSDGSMESAIIWTGLLLFGPTFLWLAFILSTLDLIWKWRRNAPAIDRWGRLRNYSLYLASIILASLIALSAYRAWGGAIPLPGLDLPYILPAIGAMVVQFVIFLLFWSGYIAYAVWAQLRLTESQTVRPVIRFLLTALGLPALSHPFAILAAGLYHQFGLGTFLFFMIGLIMVALLTRRLSWAAESQRQQSRQLEKLEYLGRDIINSPPDASTLSLILREHVPSMFPSGRVAIWVAPDKVLLNHPMDWLPDFEKIWIWLESKQDAALDAPQDAAAFMANERLPWDIQAQIHNAIVVAPILESESRVLVGFIYLELHSLSQPWDQRSLGHLFPAVLALAAQVASALHQAQIYSQALAYQKVSQELSLAGKIQASFLPDELPSLSGWQLAVTLLPAREMSGDFFDLIPLSNGKLGILIADVTDKGLGAALYMALSRTLIRTYAIEFDDDPQPDVVLFAANGRILEDARADLFVTVFYGILDPQTGTLTYSNAGHNPPYLMRSGDSHSMDALSQTGMPIGVEEETLWRKETVQLNPGDVLVLYTDGIPDAQNSSGGFFDNHLIDVIESNRGCSAQEIQDEILAGVQEFVGDAPQFDDITLIVLERDVEA